MLSLPPLCPSNIRCCAINRPPPQNPTKTPAAARIRHDRAMLTVPEGGGTRRSSPVCWAEAAIAPLLPPLAEEEGEEGRKGEAAGGVAVAVAVAVEVAAAAATVAGPSVISSCWSGSTEESRRGVCVCLVSSCAPALRPSCRCLVDGVDFARM